ncbi:MAG: hypothetical protein JXR35_08460, partial [Rhodobacteraceae bacterium]|nr:hypothetical protein [Paracoccaceae bacterium]
MAAATNQLIAYHLKTPSAFLRELIDRRFATERLDHVWLLTRMIEQELIDRPLSGHCSAIP